MQNDVTRNHKDSLFQLAFRDNKEAALSLYNAVNGSHHTDASKLKFELLDRGIPEKCTAMQAIGYKEFVAALDGKCSIEEAADQVRQSSRRYAKRQLTWFRRNQSMHWLIRHPGQDSAEILEAARQVLRENDN